MSTVIFAPKTAPKHAPKLLGVLDIYCLKSACYKTGRVISHHPPIFLSY